jgi:hypothetical protein
MAPALISSCHYYSKSELDTPLSKTNIEIPVSPREPGFFFMSIFSTRGDWGCDVLRAESPKYQIPDYPYQG